MDLKKIFNDNKAVSPVIGVVLMVAITVILAAAIGSSVFGQGPSESAPQSNIDIIVLNQTAIKLEHLGGDTILLNDSASTQIILTRADGTSIDINTGKSNCVDTFDVGRTQVLLIMDAAASTPTTMTQGEFATVKIVDIKTKQLIADKELRF
ncbi:type IV pilin [Methanosarcina sp. T3]|uniref:type IV pilin n=1 Tax=Methanosarcina sp. T3 TaxID=3439062 RepID=UPI003F82DED7